MKFCEVPFKRLTAPVVGSNVTTVTYCRVIHGAGEQLGETLMLKLLNCNFNGNGKLMRVVYGLSLICFHLATNASINLGLF